jgi:hypothetical protein
MALLERSCSAVPFFNESDTQYEIAQQQSEPGAACFVWTANTSVGLLQPLHCDELQKTRARVVAAELLV